MSAKQFSAVEARKIGERIGIDFTKYDLEQFRMGLAVEFEHGSGDPETNVTGDDPDMTGRIAWAPSDEIPDYYTRLAKWKLMRNPDRLRKDPGQAGR